jgi:hypothetical protein
MLKEICFVSRMINQWSVRFHSCAINHDQAIGKKSEKKSNSIKQFPAIILNIKKFQPEKQLVIFFLSLA